ncbi:hypothetical protein SAMN05444162_1585 [Paenibacillaceae bacterium GAS479]|nr:hypothetical protein SAMN05444162_1585 [Paenibacillaceae bacterium GAS479]
MREYKLMDGSLLLVDGPLLRLKRPGREPEPATAEQVLPELLEMLDAQRISKVARLQMELAQALDESMKLGAEADAKVVIDAYRPVLEERREQNDTVYFR